MEITMKLIYQYMAIFFHLPPSSNYFHPLQVETCDTNPRLVVDEDNLITSGFKGLTLVLICPDIYEVKDVLDQ